MAERSGRPLRLAIVDDHDLVVEGLVSWLGSRDARCEVVYAGPGAAAAATAEADVVLLDVGLATGAVTGAPAAGAMAGTVRRLGESGARVLLISAHGAPPAVLAGLRAGAAGYLGKGAEAHTLAEAIDDVAAGRMHVSRDLAAMLLAHPPPPGLDTTDVTVLRLTAAGLQPDAVAARLQLTPEEVRGRLGAVTTEWVVTAPQDPGPAAG